MNCSLHPDRAICNAVGHLQTDEYSASYGIVYNAQLGHDLAIFTRTPGKIQVLYKRKVVKRADR
jgi:hypothetical protein